MKRLICITALFMAIVSACGNKEENLLVMHTTCGDITLRLYDETPLHRDNFLKLVDDHVYDSLLFHRVIEDFMIQGGDTGSKDAAPGEFLGENDLPYTVPAEFRVEDGIFHKRGVLAAAREGDDVNPGKESSSTQFYIVWGRTFTDEELDIQQERITKSTGGTVVLSDDMRETYKTIGGTPHLDGSYTIFGEVVDGLDVVGMIQKVATDENDRPLEDIRILSVERK